MVPEHPSDLDPTSSTGGRIPASEQRNPIHSTAKLVDSNGYVEAETAGRAAQEDSEEQEQGGRSFIVIGGHE